MIKTRPHRKTWRAAAGNPQAAGGSGEIYERIPGWFSFGAIYAAAVSEARPGDTLVEVGTYLGRSAAFMAAEIRRSGKALRFVSYDSYGWRGNPAWPAPSLELARANVGDLGPFVSFVQAQSEEAALLHAPGSLAFVFLDASHDGPSVARDLRVWLPNVRPGGMIGGHDYDFPGGARRAVDAVFGPGARSDLDPQSWLCRVPAGRRE
jgi:predicted O-methyltransferase YrrM